MKTLAPIIHKKSVVFYSPVEGIDVLVRTGTIDDNSLVHSILNAVSNDYVNSDYRQRVRLVERFIDKINLPTEAVEDIEFDGNISPSFRAEVVNSLRKNWEQKSDELDVFKLMITIPELDNIIKNGKYESVEKFKESVCFKVIDYIHARHKEDLSLLKRSQLRYIESCLENIVEKIIFEAKEQYDKRIVELKLSTIHKISETLNRNIYFLDAKTRLPIKCGETYNNKKFFNKRKSIIILKVGGKYEIIGRLLAGRQIQREFRVDNSIVSRLNQILFKKVTKDLLSSGESDEETNTDHEDNDDEGNDDEEDYGGNDDENEEEEEDEDEEDGEDAHGDEENAHGDEEDGENAHGDEDRENAQGEKNDDEEDDEEETNIPKKNYRAAIH